MKRNGKILKFSLSDLRHIFLIFKDFFYDFEKHRWGHLKPTCSKYVSYYNLKHRHTLGDLYDNIMNMRIFNLIIILLFHDQIHNA